MKPKVLLLDDSQMNLVVADGFLKTQYETVSFLRAMDALKYLKEGNLVDLMVVDIMMPELDGYGFLELVKREVSLKEIPLIFLTALNDKESEVKGLELGAVDFINKPIRGEVLLARVRTHIELKRAKDKLFYQNQMLLQNHYQMLTKSKLEALGHVTAGLAHEINNPLGALKSNISTLNVYVRDLLKMIEDCIERNQDKEEEFFDQEEFSFIKEDSKNLIVEVEEALLRISNVMKSMSFYVEEEEDGERSLVDLKILVERICELMKQEGETEIFFHCQMESISIIAEKKSLGLAFYHILKNAVEAMKDQEIKEIWIDSVEEKEKIILRFQDSGNGVLEEDVDKLFHPFYTTKDVGEGFGLGLNMVYQIITERHKGSLYFDLNCKNGACVVVELPKEEK